MTSFISRPPCLFARGSPGYPLWPLWAQHNSSKSFAEGTATRTGSGHSPTPQVLRDELQPGASVRAACIAACFKTSRAAVQDGITITHHNEAQCGAAQRGATQHNSRPYFTRAPIIRAVGTEVILTGGIHEPGKGIRSNLCWLRGLID